MARSGPEYAKHPLAALLGLKAILAGLFGAQKNSVDTAASTNRAISIDFESVDEAIDAIARLASAGIAPRGIEIQAVGERCVLSIHLYSQHGSEHVVGLISPGARKISLAA
jgi:hypothetical protein